MSAILVEGRPERDALGRLGRDRAWGFKGGRAYLHPGLETHGLRVIRISAEGELRRSVTHFCWRCFGFFADDFYLLEISDLSDEELL